MKKALVLISAALLAAGAVESAPAATLETSAFISSPTYFNGFEGVTPGTLSTNSYSEGGITVSEPTETQLSTIYNTTLWGGIGNNNLYAASIPYVKIALTGGGQFQDVQFLASSGYGGPNYYVAYELLDNNNVVLSGNTPLTGYCCFVGDGYETLGFSGGGFDEVLLQQVYSSSTSFSTSPTDASFLALDNISADPSLATPVPAALPLFASGLGALGLFGWRRKRKERGVAA